MLVVDGARGEGGGQVARVALALGAATRRDVRVVNLRANRPQPGLKHGHLAAFRALAQLCDAEVEGLELGSTDVTLRPGVTVGGEYEFAVETAGPVTLVLQALLPAMAASRQAFRVKLTGGTNVAWAPQWDDFAHVHAPLLRRLGVEVQPTLHARGWFPVGRGEVEVEVATPSLQRADLTEPGPLRALKAVVASHGLPRHVAERALISVHDLDDVMAVDVEQDFHRGPGTGMAVALRAERAATVLGADAVGRKGTPVEEVVAGAVAGLRAELRAGVGVDVHQADQLPVFMALAGGGAYTCRHLTPHARTVLDLLPEFLPVAVETARLEDGRTRVDLR
ncbi:MAG TPA: RNA 3'-terminal phosphate cyclase [Candidatus Thermoplasmatota archaeon]|nr:RNA 3'-terminal phosphate cyclase [Candidatus Thermoplasmatota archaeon]